jgi:phospholipid-binding lipoprotein MlaA
MEAVNSIVKALLAGMTLAVIGGCAHNPNAPDPRDPYEQTNRKSYAFNEALDRHVLMPAAKGWQAITPIGFRQGVTNFYGNFYYLNTLLNNILQGKLLAALRDSGRVVLNTTLGIGGFFDVATPFGLPAHQEDFGQTLAVWGVGEGNYLVIPFLGPSTQRDVPGYGTAAATSPLFWVGGFVIGLPVGFLGVVNDRANLLEATRLRDEAALDPYTFTREAYRQRRDYLIRDGEGFGDDLYFDFNGEFEEGAGAEPGPAGTPGPLATPSPASGGAAPVEEGEDVLKID